MIRTLSSPRSYTPCTRALLIASMTAVLFAPTPAAAADFPVSGTLSINGNTGALPAGGTFGPSTYDPVTGTLSAGAFTFPQSTLSFDSKFGTVVVTYLLSQTNQSSGQVAADGVAALGIVTMRLHVASVTVGGLPVPVGTCDFQPITINLSGSAGPAAVNLAAEGFAIPPVAASDCGGNGTTINNAIAGSNNAMRVVMAGNFTPPTGQDIVFGNGFEIVQAMAGFALRG